MIKMGLHSFVVHNNAPPPHFSPFYDKSIVLMGKPFFYNQHKEEQERQGK